MEEITNLNRIIIVKEKKLKSETDNIRTNHLSFSVVEVKHKDCKVDETNRKWSLRQPGNILPDNEK